MYTLHQLELNLASLHILGTNEITAKVHHLCDRSVGDDPYHPKRMIQSRRISRVSIIVQDGSAGIRNLIGQKEVCQRNVTSSHVCQSSCEVDLLPFPPESIEVGVVQEEQRISWATRSVKHL